jgi:hypothetical protein
VTTVLSERIREARGVTALATVGLIVIGTVAMSSQASIGAVRPAAAHHVGATKNVALRVAATKALRGGYTVTTWVGSNGARVRTDALAGSVVSVRQGQHSLASLLTPPVGASQTPKQYAASGQSVYRQALAVGVGPAIARRMAASLGHVPGGTIFASGCQNTSPSDSDGAVGTACVQQSYLQNIVGAVYVENQITSTGEATGAKLNTLRGYYIYNNGFTYTRVGWSPSGTVKEGSPTTYTLTASGAGFSASVQETQYPDTLSPYFPNGVSEAAFGSQWSGSNKNTFDSANSVAIVHNGHGSPSNTKIGVYIAW